MNITLKALLLAQQWLIDNAPQSMTTHEIQVRYRPMSCDDIIKEIEERDPFEWERIQRLGADT